MADYDYLLQKYRLLWHNRNLLVQENSEITLKQAIKRELMDENTHPRLRRSIEKKFYLAAKRILQSSMESGVKLLFLQMYQTIAERLKE